ncbi:hypothetical protein [Streptomyces sp. NPDC051546]|uniref:hypothetical protein n=1 Tax=Streptomyces sp. NPDC051546 TaxID=3365655 RepID=UPI00378CD7A7
MHAVEDLVERVLGTSPLPRGDNDVTLLIAGLCQHLPRLEAIVGKADPALVQQARRIRKSPPAAGYMPSVVLCIRLAEVAQALIDAVPAGTVPERDRPVLFGRQTANASQNDAGRASASVPDLTTAPEAARASALHRLSVPTAELVSAAAGSLGGCGPPT